MTPYFRSSGFRLRALAAVLTAMAVVVASSSNAQAQSGKSLDSCQKTVGKEAAKYVRSLADTVGKCLEAASGSVLAKGGGAGDAAKPCIARLAKIKNSASPASELGGKFEAKLDKACDPAVNPSLGHSDADTYTIGSSTISAAKLNSFCQAFGGDGSIDGFAEWRACLRAAAECEAEQSIAMQYPRALEYLAALDTAISALPASTKQADALTALRAIDTAMEGSTDDDVPELRCGPAAAASTLGLPATGQTTCYDGSGGTIACSGTGQDGETQAGLPHNYVDNGNGTITDNSTGLTWEKLCFDNTYTICASEQHYFDTYTWDQAFAKIAALNSASYAGFSDWRLPNLKEMESIIDAGTSDPAVDPIFHSNCTLPCSVSNCSCTFSSTVVDSSYWTSTSDAGDPFYAWYVNFWFGTASIEFKTGSGRHVRAVRGGI